jgi:ADP-heptose:LPS heptosyltransferase
MLCAVPALRALRAAFPNAEIALIGLPWAASFVTRYSHLIDELIVFPGAVGFPEQAETDANLATFAKAVQDRHFDLAIQLHGSGGVANDIVALFGAPYKAGFLKPAEAERAGVFIPWPDDQPEPLRYLALMKALGITSEDASLEIPLTATDQARCDVLQRTSKLCPERLVLLHPGAQLASRRWPAQRFAAVAAALAADGWQIGITGSADESALSAIVGASISDAIDLCGRTSLGALAALVGRARLIVCNDTGLSHVAAAMRTPSVVVASGSDTHRWAPLDTARHVVLADYPACRPCDFRECPYGHPCALNISIDAVLSHARAQLAAFQPIQGTCHADIQ